MLLARTLILALAVLAVAVQLGVWGATKIRTEGALLESWQPWFGWPYALLLALALLGLCRWLGIERGSVWLARTWALVGGGLLVLRLAGRDVSLHEAAALTAGFGAVVLATGLWEGRLRVRR